MCVPLVLTLTFESRLCDGLIADACGVDAPSGLTVASDHAEFWFVRAREAVPVSNASEDRAEVGMSNETPDAVRAVGVTGKGEFGFVKVTVWPCRNCTPPSRASEAKDELVHRDVSVADETGRTLRRSVSCEAMPERRRSSLASSNGLKLSVGLIGLFGNGTADATARPDGKAGAPDVPNLTSPAWPWCSSTRRTPCAETGVMI